MKILLMVLLFLFQEQPAKIDPSGIWESSTGTQFELKLSESDLHVKLVPDSNPQFVEYELGLKKTAKVNEYEGNGYFVAKVSETKTCKFDTHWYLTVVAPEAILGLSLSILPDPETCAVKSSQEGLLQLMKKE